MKKFFLYLLIPVVFVGLAFAQFNSADGKIYTAGYGAHNSTTLQTLITRIGANNTTVVLNGGIWNVTTNITFPTNITVEIANGSYFNVSTGISVTINGAFNADPISIRSGLGTVTGGAKFFYRWPEWGPTNRVTFSSTGVVSSAYALNETLSKGNNAEGYSATNFGTLQATNVNGETGTFTDMNISGRLAASGGLAFTGSATNEDLTINGDFLVTSNDFAVSLHGYPRVTLTTNSIVRLTYYNANQKGPANPIGNMQYAFDTNMSTIAGPFTNYSGQTLMTIELPNADTYIGYVSVLVEMDGTILARQEVDIGSGFMTNTTSSIKPLMYTPTESTAMSTEIGKFDGKAGPTNSICGYVCPIIGKYVYIALDNNTAAWATTRFRDISVFGVTNSWDGIGGID